MTRSRSMTFLAATAAIPLTALAVTGASATPPTTAKVTSARSATIRVANNSRLGKILVNSRGHTLYLFKKDRGTKSACFGQCATFWPPLRASGKPPVGSGVKASLVGTTKRSDGKPQVTYNGHPLYTFLMDTKAGDTKGQNFSAFGARWFAVTPSGKQVPVR